MTDFQPLSGREFPRFSAIRTFFRLPHSGDTDEFDVALLGVPFDGGVSYRPGARFAPASVRDFSSLGRTYHMESQLSVFQNLRVADVGDCSVVPLSLEKSYEKIEQRVSLLLQGGKRVLSVGGDHSVSLAILRAFRKKYSQALGFVHFDAHLDSYPAAWGCEYHHGSFARHAIEEGLVDPHRMIQIGIRGPLADSRDLEFPRQAGVRIYTVDHVRNGTLNDLVEALPDFGSHPTYISFDVDCLDPAFAPGTGTPVVGGLTSYEAQRILRGLKIQNLVGGDVVEISPPYDHAGLTSLVGVDVLFQMLSLMAAAFGNGK